MATLSYTSLHHLLLQPHPASTLVRRVSSPNLWKTRAGGLVGSWEKGDPQGRGFYPQNR